MRPPSDIQLFYDAVRDPMSGPAGIRESQRKIIGFSCSYAPEELIWAAGCHPLRLFSAKSDILRAENHLQAYCCSLVRGILEDSLSGKLDFLWGTVFPHTCDSMQRLSDIWRMKNKYAFFADLTLPVKLSGDSPKIYLLNVLEKFRSQLETAMEKEITVEDLARAIGVFNRIRKSLSAVYAHKSRYPSAITNTDLHALVMGAMIMDREKAAHRLERIARDIEGITGPDSGPKRLVLSGSVCDAPKIYQLIESAGAAVVGDDLCTGWRWVDTGIETAGDPMAAIAGRLLGRVICPAKHVSLTARAENLQSVVEETRADGVVFMLLKFCDPHAFDYPYLKAHLENRGIRTLLVEMDDQQESLGQISTRIETFVHMM